MTKTTTKRPRLSNAVTKPMTTLGMGLILASGTFGAAVAAEGTPTPTTSTTGAAAPADGSAAAKQLPASTVTKVSVDTSSYDVNKNNRLDLNESAGLKVDFALPADAKAGDTFTVAVQAPFKLGVSGSGVKVQDKAGRVLGEFTQNGESDSRLATFTVDKGAEGLEDVTGSATLPLQSAATPDGKPIMVTYAINGETAKPTSTQLSPQIGRPGSSSSIIYPAGSNDGTVAVSAVAFATPGKNTAATARDITMVFTPNSDNWHFDPSFKAKYNAGQLKIDATLLSTGAVLDKSKVEVVSSSADKVVVKIKGIPTNDGVRVQLPMAAGIGVDDGKPLKLSVLNTGTNVALAGTPMLSQAAQPNAAGEGAGLLPPTATDDEFTVNPEGTAKIDFLANDKANQEGATLTRGVLFVNGKAAETYTQEGEGTYTVAKDGKSVEFKAAKGFSNKKTTPVAYKVFDSNNKAAVANITGSVKEAPVTPDPTPTENASEAPSPKPTETAPQEPSPKPSETASETPTSEPTETASEKPAPPVASPTQSQAPEVKPDAPADPKPADPKPVTPPQETLIKTGFAAQNGDGDVAPTPLGYAALAAAVAALGGLGYGGYRLIRKNHAQ